VADPEEPHPIPAGRIAQLWSWLPAFRVVAETENLRAAAELLHVTPSALSRTIRVLEDSLERQLFDRRGRNLHLNNNGRLLLARTREAMRGVDEGLRDLYRTRFNADLRVSSVGIGPAFVLPALAALRDEHPRLRPRHQSMATGQIVGALSTGQLDVAFHETPLAAHELTIERLGQVESGLYCGRGHPLFRRRALALDEVLKHEFVAPPATEGDRVPDAWPVEVPRKVGFVVDTLAHGIELCRSGRYLALLPAVFATEGMRRLPCPPMAPTPLFAVRRRPLSDVDPVSELVAKVREQMRHWALAEGDEGGEDA
jgi:DNA-binding transcriptional LysR family regulator